MGTIYGYAKGFYYDSQGAMNVKVRIPSIHGPYNQKEYMGRQIHNYVQDRDLPYYPSTVLPREPKEGDTVMLYKDDSLGGGITVIGLTGTNYNDGVEDASDNK